jgi:DNA repair protein RadA/Sms
VRPVGQTEARLKEAAKLGFTAALMPPQRGRTAAGGVTPRELRHLRHLVELFDAPRPRVERDARASAVRR